MLLEINMEDAGAELSDQAGPWAPLLTLLSKQ
jgi:hypothetical protein